MTEQQRKIEAIDGVDLATLVEESSRELIADKRRQAANLIKQHLQRIEGLAQEVRRSENVLKKAQEKLKKAQDKINKIKGGDWSLLADKQDGPQKTGGDTPAFTGSTTSFED